MTTIRGFEMVAAGGALAPACREIGDARARRRARPSGRVRRVPHGPRIPSRRRADATRAAADPRPRDQRIRRGRGQPPPGARRPGGRRPGGPSVRRVRPLPRGAVDDLRGADHAGQRSRRRVRDRTSCFRDASCARCRAPSRTPMRRSGRRPASRCGTWRSSPTRSRRPTRRSRGRACARASSRSSSGSAAWGPSPRRSPRSAARRSSASMSTRGVGKRLRGSAWTSRSTRARSRARSFARRIASVRPGARRAGDGLDHPRVLGHGGGTAGRLRPARPRRDADGRRLHAGDRRRCGSRTSWRSTPGPSATGDARRSSIPRSSRRCSRGGSTSHRTHSFGRFRGSPTCSRTFVPARVERRVVLVPDDKDAREVA